MELEDESGDELEGEHISWRKQDVHKKTPLGGRERSWVGLEVRMQGMEWAALRCRASNLVTRVAVPLA